MSQCLSQTKFDSPFRNSVLFLDLIVCWQMLYISTGVSYISDESFASLERRSLILGINSAVLGLYLPFSKKKLLRIAQTKRK